MTATRRPPFEALARFRVVEEFDGGEGWSGAVREPGGATVFLKVLDGRRLEEASLLASLEHPRIPRVLEVGELPDGHAYLVREYLDGRPLGNTPALSRDDTRDLARQLLEILAFIHTRGIHHFDIKPANILCDQEEGRNRYRLVDFGLGARTTGDSAGGTPFFAAPERILGLPGDARSDLFSLGVVLYCALLPAGATLPLERHRRLFPEQDFLTAVGRAPESAGDSLDPLITRLLAQRPSDRFFDAEDALEFLVGRTGRPSLALLRPDPIGIHGEAVAGVARRLADRIDLHLAGDSHEVRCALALHATTALSNRVGVATEIHGPEVWIRRGGAGATRVEIPPLTDGQIADHLHRALRLPAEAADQACEYLRARGCRSAGDLGSSLVELAGRGAIVPDGTRWIWPDAVSGRLPVQPADEARAAPADPDALRRAATAGQVELATGAYRRRVSGLDAAADRTWRAALVEGLLLAGEPARCLPFVADLPVHHARVLLDLGELNAAAARLDAGAAAPGADPRPDVERDRRRIRATIEHLQGRPESALAILQPFASGAPERITLGHVLLALGRAAAADELLGEVLAELSEADQPFLCAAALTSRGACQRALGDLVEAGASYRHAGEILHRLGHVRHTATAETNLGLIAKDLGRFDEAIEHQRRARAMFEHVGDRHGMALAQANYGILNLTMGDPHSALPRLRGAFEEFERIDAGRYGPLLAVRLAEAHAALGEADAARRWLERAGSPAEPALCEAMERIEQSLEVGPAPAAPIDEDATVMRLGPDSAVPKEVFRTFLAVNRRLAAEADLSRAMTYLLDAAVTLTGGRSGYLLVLGEDGLRQEYRCGETDHVVLAFSRSMVNRAIQQQRTHTGDDALADRELTDMPSVQDLRQRSALCAPFRSAAGHQGALYVEHPTRAGVFGPTEKEHLEILADQAAIAVDRMVREHAMASELQQSRHDLRVARRAAPGATATMLGESPPMQELRRQIEKVAGSGLSVLIRGETGSGKELVARALHRQSTRNKGPFVAENCSAIPENLMESEFFGHRKGAFTGADQDRAGLLEMASGGTLFLDEIGDMPLALQAKLLRAIQESAVRRVGDTKTVPIDVRLVSATHRDMRKLVDEDGFREDLYFRIAAVEVLVPPLRERGEDVLLLARTFLDELNRQHRRGVQLSPRVARQLTGYPWPGNVRELHHVMSRAFILADGDELGDLSLPDLEHPGGEIEWPAIPLREAEHRTIRAALRVTGGDKTKAAKLLGISRTAIYEKLRRLEEAEESSEG